MRAIAQETAPQITLRKCSKEAGGRSVYESGKGRIHAIKYVLNFFQWVLRSAAAAAHDLILSEVDGKCQFAVDTK